jgi:hypothetical protein
LLKVDGISEPGNVLVPNQDRWGFKKDLAWVIDGATNLDGMSVSPDGDDGAWIAEATHRFLLNWDSSSNSALQDSLIKLSDSLASDYMRWTQAANITPLMQPSAALAVIRLTDSEIEYLLLGDCSITFLNPIEHSFTLLTPTDLGRLDQIAIQELAGFMRQGLSFSEAKEAVNPTLQRHRRMMNQSHGYWIFGLESSAIGHAVHGRLPVDEGSIFVLASDGFSRIWDTYNMLQPGWNSYQEIERKGLASVLERLRATERQDFDAIKWPRLKISDDASVVVAKVEIGD